MSVLPPSKSSLNQSCHGLGKYATLGKVMIRTWAGLRPAPTNPGIRVTKLDVARGDGCV
jgi:hypothetical protein